MPAKKKVVDARADSDGDINAVRFVGNTSFTSIDKAVDMADRGLIENAHAVHPSSGKPYLRSNPNDKKADNLDEMAGDHKPC